MDSISDSKSEDGESYSSQRAEVNALVVQLAGDNTFRK